MNEEHRKLEALLIELKCQEHTLEEEIHDNKDLPLRNIAQSNKLLFELRALIGEIEETLTSK